VLVLGTFLISDQNILEGVGGPWPLASPVITLAVPFFVVMHVFRPNEAGCLDGSELAVKVEMTQSKYFPSRSLRRCDSSG
jgi:hypothetical protein